VSPRYLWLLGWIVLYLVAGEVVLEFRAHRKGWDTPVFGPVSRVSAPTASARSPAFGPDEGFPFRSPRIDPERRDGVARWWIASASHAEDVHLPPELVFPNRLAVMRTRAGSPTEILNASRAGDSIAVNIERLVRLAPVWQPDLAILYQGSLDIDRLAKRHLAEDGPAMGAGEAADEARPADESVPWTVRALESTTTFELLTGTLTAWLGTQRVLSDRLGAEALAEFEAIVHEFVEVSRALGVAPVLCTFATSHSGEQLDEIPREIVLGLFQYNMYLSMRGWTDSVERVNAIVTRIAREERIPLVDVAAKLTGQSVHFRDFVHFTPDGHARVAEILRDGLESHTR